jgi:hypothetical protein
VASADGRVRATFPAGAAATDLAVSVTPLEYPTQLLPAGKRAALSFTFTALDRAGQPVTQTLAPFTLTVSYSDAELDAQGLYEQTLNLAYWDGSRWATLLPCAGCRVDTVNNRATVVFDHMAEFALLGSDRRLYQYLPLVIR